MESRKQSAYHVDLFLLCNLLKPENVEISVKVNNVTDWFDNMQCIIFLHKYWFLYQFVFSFSFYLYSVFVFKKIFWLFVFVFAVTFGFEFILSVLKTCQDTLKT